MTRDEIIAMAREAKASFETAESMFEFARLIEAAARKDEREACAKVCEEIEDDYRERESFRYAELKTDAQTGASDCAAAIRARGKPDAA